MFNATKLSKWMPVAFSCLVTVALVALTVQAYSVGAYRPSMVLGVLAIGALLSALLRLGWSVPCLVVGAVIGMILDANPKSGPIDAQLRETVASIMCGTMVGLFLGLSLDLSRKSLPSRLAPNKSLHPTATTSSAMESQSGGG
jgi:hypothetical protein